MSEPPVEKFFSGAKSLSGSPLGIIALFILLVYGFAALTFGVSVANLGEERLIIMWFLVIFPGLVLGVFTIFVIFYPHNIYGPTDFVNQADYLKLQELLLQARKENALIKEVSNVALPPALPGNHALLPSGVTAVAFPQAKHADDPQKGRWGGKREDNNRKITVGKITPLKSDPNYFNVPLRVVSTDPANHPLTGTVRFHLHDSFNPDVEEVQVKNGVAKLNLVSYGAFTVGTETDDGTKLEIDLTDPDIDAPLRFKQN